MLVVVFPISVANGQLISSSRDPDVRGSVIDNVPFNWNSDGDSVVQSSGLIGNINGTIRKAVIEYDISDIVPGVLESARITGRIGPNNAAPSGERTHDISVSSGDGVVNIADNVGGGFGVGFIQHEAGIRTDYDIDVTRAFRSVVLDDTGYLKQRVSPSTATQGWDAASMSKLELTLRPTSNDTTVYYQAPAAGAEATATNSGSFSVDVNATRMEVKDRTYSPFEQSRGIVEYDLSSIPATAEVLWAVLDVDIAGYQSQSGVGPTLEIVGYQGDGIASAADVMASAEWLGSTGQIQKTGPHSWTISPQFVETILQSGNHLGLLIQPGLNSSLDASIRLTDTSSNGGRLPRLAIAYAPGVLLGDVDMSGVVDFLDISPFIGVLSSNGGQAEADCDQDGDVDFLDITPFIAILSGQ